MKTVYFLKPQDITPPGKEAVVMAFPFHIAGDEPADEEIQQTSDFRILVTISNERIMQWKVGRADIQKLLLHHASNEIVRRLKSHSLEKRMQLSISESSHPGANPTVPLHQLPDASGYSVKVKVT